MLAGSLVYLVGAFKLMIQARQIGPIWFVGCLFSILIPFFCIRYWKQARKPFFILLGGFILMLAGALMLP
jgi:hypothetical protein